ncbi:MAG: hypothetical protein ACRDJ2_10105 [Actinomycetota bacterium]
MKVDALTRPWALLCALVLVVATLSMSGTAAANHDTRTLRTTKDATNERVNDLHIFTARLSSDADLVSGDIEIDVEIAGPGDPAGVGEGDTPSSPDDGCTVVVGARECTVRYDGQKDHVPGTDTVRAWIDHDKSNAVAEADVNEGQDAAATPGDTPEPDVTDVSTVRWFTGLPGRAELTCDDGAAAVGGTISVQCRLTSNNSTPLSMPGGWLIDGENMDGANDPDNHDGYPGTADYKDGCTTGPTGVCTISVPPESPGEEGPAEVCFWVDEDGDDSFHSTPLWDGAKCDDPEGANNNTTDVVALEWGPEARAVNLTASRATVTSGQSFTLRGSVDSGAPACAEGVDVELQKAGNSGSFRTVTTLNTGTDDRFSSTLTSKVNASYRAVLEQEPGQCMDATSSPARVEVKKKLTLGSKPKAVERGQKADLRAKVLSCTSGQNDRVVLFKKVGGVFKRSGALRTNANCVATFSKRITKRSVFKATSPKDADQLAGSSRSVTVRLK